MSILKKYTPGPWQLTTVPFELRNTDSAASIYGPLSKDLGACLIADISRSAGDVQATYNARTISKVPEMLSIIDKLSTTFLSNISDNEDILAIQNEAIELLNKLNSEI